MGSAPVPSRYLDIGQQLASLLGSSLQDASADSLRDLARAYDPSADESRISAEVFLFFKYLLVQACVGVFPESEADSVVQGLLEVLKERAAGLDFSSERQQAMEQMWRLRAAQFDQPFSQDRTQFLNDEAGVVYWKETVNRFCQNVADVDSPPDSWAGSDGPSQAASHAVTMVLDRMVSALGEMNRFHFRAAD